MRPETILIRNGRLIDGSGRGPLERVSILIGSGRFREITQREITTPRGVPVIDATGKTILPGLIDMHAHLLSGGFDTISEKSMSYDPADQRRALKQMLYWGVTGVCDPVQPLASGLTLRAQITSGSFPSPRLFISGPGFTAPGGWAGSNHPDARFEPGNMQEARQQIDKLARSKVDFIKIFYDDMSDAFAFPLPKLDKELMRAIISQAHARKIRTMVHVYDTEGHKDAIGAGADIMAHSAITAPVDDGYIQLARKNRTLYLSTLSVYHDVFDEVEIRTLISQDFVRKTVPRKTLATLEPREPLASFEKSIKQEYIKKQLPTIDGNLRRVFEAGIPIAVGPDTGVPGAFPGIAVHREMELMVGAGVPPGAVLVAATKTGAEYLGQSSIGTIERGKRADLLLVNGDPLKDIKDTRKIELVMKDGRVIDREKLLTEIMD
jgi:imidazolonepropionase-like amidohydrolase